MIRFALFLLPVLFLGTPAAAQQNTARAPVEAPELAYRQSFLADPPYRVLTETILGGRYAYFDFRRYRVLYSHTSQYDPLGTKTLGRMNELAFTAINDESPQSAAAALTEYHNLVSRHLAHLGVVMQALSLARQDSRFGSPVFFEKLRDQLMQQVMVSGDGYTLQGAYDVITLAEEKALLERLGLERTETRVVQEGIVYYSMHDGIDPETAELRTVFVNTSVPMKYLQALYEIDRKSKSLDFMRQ